MTPQSLQTVAKLAHRRYGSPVAANSATGLGRPTRHWRTGAHHPTAGAFFVPDVSSYGGCARDTFGYAGFLCPRSANPRTAATPTRLAANGDSSPDKGAVPMKHTLNPSVTSAKAAAHRAMTMAALHADSSLSVRLKRYNTQMAIARTLETAGAPDNCAEPHNNLRNAVIQGV